MKQFFTFQSFPMLVVVGLIVFSWVSLLSVLVASLF